ncbi:hypothetical protein [Agromyces seonyuensis]|uniref:FtsX-like permease family protein n=1 Tax=Agromyces seonyuensis TaxID=2662446 RepID=A0A6I4P3G6_9MICO|nr:hypothetical protein [Agromyces seonyuensis]MWB99375.1 hypothetical protein [Agromyces seonyuensis]
MSAHRSRLSGTALSFRRFAAAPGPSILLAMLVLVAAFTATAVPRLIATLHTDSLRQQLAGPAPAALDPTAAFVETPAFGDSAGASTLPSDVGAVWGAQEAAALAARDALPSPLRDVLGAPLALTVFDPASALPATAAAGGTTYSPQVAVDPRLHEHVELVEGDWPAAFDGSLPPSDGDDPLEIVLAAPVAEAMAWQPGETRMLAYDDAPGADVPTRLSGTVAPLDADDGFWSHALNGLEPSIKQIGNAPPDITGLAFVDPASWTPFRTVERIAAQTQVWFPVELDEIRAADSPELIAQLSTFASTAVVLGPGGWIELDPLTVDGVERWSGSAAVADRVGFTSDLRTELETAVAEAAAVDAVLAALVSGPAGVAVAVLVLAARVVFERRRPGLELEAARGASTGRLRTTLAGEALAVSVPAALLGGAAGMLVATGDAGAGGWIVAAIFALVPAALLAGQAGALSPLRRQRSDLGAGGAGRFRWIGEVLVVALAAVALGLLLQRGLSTAAAATGIDPLLAAVPLLLALAACVLVLRLYPLPLRSLVARLRRSRGLVSFVGAARALRDPAAGLVPVLAVVVGVAVATFSSVLLATVETGTSTAAAARIGADLRVSGLPFTTEQLDGFAAVDGVAATAPVYASRTAPLAVDGHKESVTVLVVDVAELEAVQAGRPDALELPAALTESGSAIPVLASSSVAADIAAEPDPELDGRPVEVVGSRETPTPFSDRDAWVLVDRSQADGLVPTLVPRAVVVRLEPGADPDAVAAAVQEIAGVDAIVQTPGMLEAELAERPVGAGLAFALTAAIVVSSLLTALAIVLTLIVGRPGRAALLPLLTTLGLGRRGERALVAWEIGPMTIVAAVAGIGVGVLLPFAVLAGIDLTAFTGGDVQPAIIVDPLLVVAVAGGALAVAALAVAIAGGVGDRQDAARAMRKETEG